MHAPPHISTKRHLRIEDLSCAGTHSVADVDTVQIASVAPLYENMCSYVFSYFVPFRLFNCTFHHCRPTVQKYVFLCVGTCSHTCVVLFETLILYTCVLSCLRHWYCTHRCHMCHVCIYVYIYTYIYEYICIRIYTCIDIFIYMYVYIHLSKYIYIHICVYCLVDTLHIVMCVVLLILYTLSCVLSFWYSTHCHVCCLFDTLHMCVVVFETLIQYTSLSYVYCLVDTLHIVMCVVLLILYTSPLSPHFVNVSALIY